MVGTENIEITNAYLLMHKNFNIKKQKIQQLFAILLETYHINIIYLEIHFSSVLFRLIEKK